MSHKWTKVFCYPACKHFIITLLAQAVISRVRIDFPFGTYLKFFERPVIPPRIFQKVNFFLGAIAKSPIGKSSKNTAPWELSDETDDKTQSETGLRLTSPPHIPLHTVPFYTYTYWTTDNITSLNARFSFLHTRSIYWITSACSLQFKLTATSHFYLHINTILNKHDDFGLMDLY